jgi:nitrile hydratase subunit beta
MDGVHDMGGEARHFGPLPTLDPEEPVFHEPWEAKAFALALLANRVSGANLHAFRHAIERVPEEDYLSGYYERWLASAEILLVDSGILAPGAVAARAENLRGGQAEELGVPEPHKPTMPSGGGGNLRTVEQAPAFAPGDAVTTRSAVVSTHTRLPAYARGKAGTVVAVQPAHVLPDTAAHFVGENPEHVYAVAFDARELWGADAEPFTLTLDLFESYLEKA